MNLRMDLDTPASSDRAFDYERWFREHPPRRDALHRLYEAVTGRKASGERTGVDGDGQTESDAAGDDSNAA